MSDEPDGQQPDDDGEDLGGLAQAALDIPGMPGAGDAVQDPLDGTDYTVIKFLGLKYTELEHRPPIGTRMRFEIEVMVVGDGNELMANEQIRHTVRCRPVSIFLIAPSEPESTAETAAY